ncbi:MAG: antirepressor regulating drug resistance protein [Planctomycetota bacterium]|nr:antirepressor regulating drug resistance protein [Planctomycetota bacterium]
METLWDMGLANALVVAAVVPVAAVLGRIAKRPAWSHALWVIVLLKLVTPPLAGVSIGTASMAAATPRTIENASVKVEPVAIAPAVAHDEIKTYAPVVRAPIKARVPTRGWRLPEVSCPRVLGTLWLGGSAAWLILAAWRIGRFTRVMRRAEEAPEELTAWVESLSSRLGLARAPIVILSPGRLAPMVWALGGRPRLVVPESLWKRLDQGQRSALLVHELAHLKRRDHWVRLLELIATGLYWWHPALWWARKGLHRAEEECCDLWVVWALPDAKRTYATALVEAVEFLSETRPRRLPIGASGMGQVEDLSRRIGMIMRGDTPRGLTRTGLLAAIGLAVLLLPWRPTIAQQEPLKPVDSKPNAAGVLDDVDSLIAKKELERAKYRLEWSKEMLKKGYVSKDQVLAEEAALLRAQKTLKRGEIAKGHEINPNIARSKGVQDVLDDDTKQYTDSYTALRKRLKTAQSQEERVKALQKQGAISNEEVDKARADVLELQERLARLKGRERVEAEEREQAARQASEEVEILKTQVQTKRAEVAKARAQRNPVLADLARLDRLSKSSPGLVSREERDKAVAELGIADAQIAVAQAEVGEYELKLKQAMERAERLARIVSQNKVGAEATSPSPIAVDRGSVRPNVNRDADKRLDELESKLDRVLKELEAIRKEKAEKPSAARFESPAGPRFDSRSAPPQ